MSIVTQGESATGGMAKIRSNEGDSENSSSKRNVPNDLDQAATVGIDIPDKTGSHKDDSQWDSDDNNEAAAETKDTKAPNSTSEWDSGDDDDIAASRTSLNTHLPKANSQSAKLQSSESSSTSEYDDDIVNSAVEKALKANSLSSLQNNITNEKNVKSESESDFDDNMVAVNKPSKDKDSSVNNEQGKAASVKSATESEYDDEVVNAAVEEAMKQGSVSNQGVASKAVQEVDDNERNTAIEQAIKNEATRSLSKLTKEPAVSESESEYGDDLVNEAVEKALKSKEASANNDFDDSDADTLKSESDDDVNAAVEKALKEKEATTHTAEKQLAPAKSKSVSDDDFDDDISIPLEEDEAPQNKPDGGQETPKAKIIDNKLKEKKDSVKSMTGSVSDFYTDSEPNAANPISLESKPDLPLEPEASVSKQQNLTEFSMKQTIQAVSVHTERKIEVELVDHIKESITNNIVSSNRAQNVPDIIDNMAGERQEAKLPKVSNVDKTLGINYEDSDSVTLSDSDDNEDIPLPVLPFTNKQAEPSKDEV